MNEECRMQNEECRMKRGGEKVANVILEKSKDYAIRIINLYKYLCEEKSEYVLSKQILRSGTSIGANCREASRGQSKSDFVAKMSIALKEADETEYWLELLKETDCITAEQYQSLNNDNEELIKLLVTIIKSSKQNNS